MKKISARAYRNEQYARIITPDEQGGFYAEVLEFPGCFAEGETPNEAFANLERAAESWIEAALGQGNEIPEPSSNIGYSGKIALRLPKSMHRQAVRLAERNGTSLNQFLVSAIAARIGAEELYDRLAQRFEHRIMARAPAAVVPILKFGLQQFPDQEEGPMTMDAARVNPQPKSSRKGGERVKKSK